MAVHNIMVNVRVEEGATEDSSFFETVDKMSDTWDSDVEPNTDRNNGCVEDNVNKNKNGTGKNKQVMSQILVRERHFVMIQKMWKALYDVGEVVCLQDAINIHLFKNKFGEDAVHHGKIDPVFDPLVI
jgi:hypothetical protein